MNYTPLPIDKETERQIKSEFLSAIRAPDYATDPGWYEQHCVKQDHIAVILLDQLKAQDMPTVERMLNKLETQGVRLSHFQMFVTRPNHCGMWHIDGNYREASVNIPLFNCDVGCIEWTDTEMPDVVRFQSEFTRNLRSSYKGAYVDDRLVLSRSHLVRASNWHRINNLMNDRHRVVFSFRFAGNPKFGIVKSAIEAAL